MKNWKLFFVCGFLYAAYVACTIFNFDRVKLVFLYAFFTVAIYYMAMIFIGILNNRKK
jgi:hypothetical protein